MRKRDKLRAWKKVVDWAKECDTIYNGHSVVAEFFVEDIKSILLIDEELKSLREKAKTNEIQL